MVLESATDPEALIWGMPDPTGTGSLPGTELDYAEGTGTITVTSTTEGTETTVLAGNSVTFDGGAYMIEFYAYETMGGAIGHTSGVTRTDYR